MGIIGESDLSSFLIPCTFMVWWCQQRVFLQYLVRLCFSGIIHLNYSYHRETGRCIQYRTDPVWRWRTLNLHRLHTVSVRLQPLSHGIEVSGSKTLCTLIPFIKNSVNYFVLFLRCFRRCEVVTRWNKKVREQTKWCCNGENSGSVKSVGLRPIPYTYTVFPMYTRCLVPCCE